MILITTSKKVQLIFYYLCTILVSFAVNTVTHNSTDFCKVRYVNVNVNVEVYSLKSP